MNYHIRLALGLAALAGVIRPLAAQSIYTPYNFVTIAGGNGSGSADGTGSGAQFYYPDGIAIAPNGNLFVGDTDNQTIRELTPTVTGGVTTWASSTIAGSALISGTSDGVGSAARFSYPIGVAVDTNNNLYVADGGNGEVRKVVPSVSGGVTTWTVSTLASGFAYPAGVVVDSNGNVYVDEQVAPCAIYKISPGGVVTPLAGQAGGPGYADGPGTSALFNNPYQLAIDSSGNLFVADAKNHLIRKVTPAGVVSTVAGIYGDPGAVDGPVASATLGDDLGIAVDSSDNVYFSIASYANEFDYGPTVRLLTAGGEVTTLGGVPEGYGFVNGSGSTARFDGPFGLAVDSHGNIYVADSDNAAIREGSPPVVAPAITQAASPSTAVVDPGRSVAFNAAASGTPAPSYQWTLNGSATIPGAAITTDPILLITGTTAANDGTYTCTATNTGGSATTTATLTVQATASPARLDNLSARAEDLSGGDILIAGLTVGGSGTEPLLIRGVGPALAMNPFNLTGVLPNPVVTLFDHQSVPIVSDQGWGNALQPGSSAVDVSPAPATITLMNQVGAFLIPQGSADSAMGIEIEAPGSYTLEVTDANGATGIGLAEVYDAGSSSSPTRLTNISARADVGAGGDILIGGLTIAGSSAETVLLRAVGPGLVYQGLPANSGLLAQPSLAVYQGSTQIYGNTVWGGDQVIASSFPIVGAAHIDNGSTDCAVLITLPAGGHTVLVSGVNNTSGIGLVEVYEVY